MTTLLLRLRFYLSLVFVLLSGQVLWTQEKLVIIGGPQTWPVQSACNLTTTRGLRGYHSYVLAPCEVFPVKQADLHLTFSAPKTINLQGNYKLLNENEPIFISNEYARRGTASAFFVGNKYPLILKVKNGSLFTPDTQQEQFTISFWLLANQNHNAEILISWKGLIDNKKVWRDQLLQASLKDSCVEWTFKNLFFGSHLQPKTIKIKGLSQLKPKTWSQHTLRYSTRTGDLEYYVNGLPEAVTQVYEDNDPYRTPLPLCIGSINDRQLILGENFTGALDDIFFSRACAKLPPASLYTSEKGTLITQVIDLGKSACTLNQVKTLQTCPHSTYLNFYYRLGDEFTFERDEKSGENLKQVVGEWKVLPTNSTIKDSEQGRYLQIKVDFLPEGTGNYTPSLSMLAVEYQENLLAGAPTILSAQAGDGQIIVRWLPSLSSKIKGYLVYYGEEPKVYYGTGKQNSPVDVGNTTSYTLKGLTNEQLYYVSIRAYGQGNPPSLSDFSNEMEARPLATPSEFTKNET